MNQAFDAYQAWLGIPPAEQPPHHYRLLGVKLFEANLEAIAGAATNLTARIRALQQPPHQLAAYHLLAEIEKARSVLLDPVQRAHYDVTLRTQMSQRPADAWPPGTARSAAPIPTAERLPQAVPLGPAAAQPVALPKAAPLPAPTPLPVAQSLPQPAPIAAAALPATVAPVPQPQPQPTKPTAKPTASTARRREGSPLMQLVKIVLGGGVGLVLGYLVVYFITGNDFAGILPSRVPQANPGPIAAAPATRPVPREPVNAAPNVPPSTALVPPAAPAPTFPPLTPPANAGGTDPPAPATPTETTPAAPMPPTTPAPKPAPLPGTTPEPPPAPSAVRQPTPSPDAQQKMLAELQSIYKAQFERGSKADGRAEFLAFCQKTAHELKTEPVAQFVLWRQSYDVAIGLADFVSAADAIDELDQLFEVDGFRLRLHLLTQASQAARRPEERVPLLPFALALADFAVRTQRMEELPKLANMAESLARTADKETRNQVAAKAIELRKAATDFTQVKTARAKLAAEPNNAAAALIDGRFRCFVAGEWTKGLPLLAQSDHAALVAASKQDLAGPSESVKASQLGDAWFDLAAADPALGGGYHRAAHWYRQAAGTAQGLEKVKIDKRLEQIAELNLPPQPAENAAAPTLPAARALLTGAKSFERSDLLAQMTQDTIRTPGWSVNPGYLRVVSSADYARIQSPVNPSGEYQTLIRVRRTSPPQSRAGIFVVGLPHPRSQFLVVLDHPFAAPGGQSTASFLTLSGLKRPEDNPTLKLQTGAVQQLEFGRERTLLCSVSLNEIRVTLDGEPLLEYRGDMNKLAIPREWSVPDARALFLGAHQGSFSIDGWAVGPLRDASGKETPLNLPASGVPRFNPLPFNPQP